MWKNNRNNVDKVFKEWVNGVFISNPTKYSTTYPKIKTKIKIKYSQLKALYNQYTYSHP